MDTMPAHAEIIMTISLGEEQESQCLTGTWMCRLQVEVVSRWSVNADAEA